ncbi:MAG: pantoate--beta-alanine ligase [Robiginitomaculum sp.]|nr:pantoate--beta-alanine ligase [Robiginitomaculum sp.]
MTTKFIQEASFALIKSESDLRARIWNLRNRDSGSGETIAFVPTMGALHAGHISLITKAKQHADKVVASIYVNETQFASGEDLDTYPRDHERDCAMLKAAGCDLVYIPEKMYDTHHATTVNVGGPALGLETNHRAHFFSGVALIVTKLLNRVQPDIAIFGEKDYQQLLTIRQLATDLDIPVRILGAPILREQDGLAMSSRNRYFDKESRKIAGQLNVIMRQCAEEIASGADINTATTTATKHIIKAGFDSVDYVAAADTNSLKLLTGNLNNRRGRLLIAAHCKGVRLIDNCRFG